MTTGQKIKKLRISRGMTQEELAKHIGVSKQAVQKYESEAVTNIPIDKISKMATILGTTPSYLAGWGETPISVPGSKPITIKKLPMLGNVAAGEPIFVNAEHDVFIEAPDSLCADFCLTVKGDSMIYARIFDGDVIFAKSTSIVDNGQIAVVLIDDEATVKRVYYDRENDTITLMPENPTYKPMRYTGTDLDRVRIVGKVVSGQYHIN